MESKYTDLIESYLSGELTEQESKEFESELAGNALLREALNAYKDMTSRLEGLRLRNHIKAAKADASPKTLDKRKLLLFSAACVLVAAIVWIFVFRYQDSQQGGENKILPGGFKDTSSAAMAIDDSAAIQKHENPKNVDSNFGQRKTNPSRPYASLAEESYEKPVFSVLRSASKLSELDRFKELFNEGKYAAVADSLKRKSAGSEEYRFLRGHALFNTGDFKGAAVDFLALENSLQYKNGAQWRGCFVPLHYGLSDKRNTRDCF